MDKHTAEYLGWGKRESKDARDDLEAYERAVLASMQGGSDVAKRIKAVMTERHLIEGQGVVIPKGTVYMMAEEDFDIMNKRLGGKLKRAGKPRPTAPAEKEEVEAAPRVLTSKRSVSKKK